MDINLLAISECISLYYEVLAIMTYQCNTRNCLKVRFLFLYNRSVAKGMPGNT